VPVRCITVDSPEHLYLAGRSFIPTHNCRDNFATRISLGRLSPQGAMMMWEASYVGVAVPRGVPGRGTAVSDDDYPIEVQGYWTPDPRRAARANDAEDLAVLERLRPRSLIRRCRCSCRRTSCTRSTTHPASGGPSLLPSSSRHPRWHRTRCWTGPADPQPCWRWPPQLQVRPRRPTDQDTGADQPDHSEGQGDEGDRTGLDDGYGSGEEIGVDLLAQGDVVLIEAAIQLWGVVENVEPDLVDDSLICIGWRADDDEFGSLSVPDDSSITTRRPLEQDFKE